MSASGGPARALDPTTTRDQALAFASRVLAGSGLAEPRREALLLLRGVLGIDVATVMSDGGAAIGTEAGRLAEAIGRRARREPLSRILGQRAFWTLELEVGPETLDPRPDTETVVEVILAELRRADRTDAPLRILDLGTGTGAILLALLSELTTARGLGIDVSPGALSVARRNAAANGLAGRAEFATGSWTDSSWTDGVNGPFDVIVSNPPYIPTADIAGLEPEVAGFDPQCALDGGPDGLDAYRAIVPAAARLLAPHGVLAVEIGMTQGPAVDALMAGAELMPLTPAGRVWPDLSGRPRCVAAKSK